ncbi:MAG: pyruvate kinase [Leptospiraceae bacterium]|nr:pyruvate kinase [Leptospiraceae bacterium]
MNHNFLRKKTKIVCTIGPASGDEKTLMELIGAGLDIARMNFSHSTHEDHQKIYETIRKCEQKSKRPIGILADLQGPKIRTGKLAAGPIELFPGEKIYINTDSNFPGTKEEIGSTYPNLLSDLEVDHKVLIDDGNMVLVVRSKDNHRALLEVLVGGTLSNNKGINLPSSKISAPPLSPKDMEDLQFALSLGVDYIALSFVRKASDLVQTRQLMQGSYAGLIAKIETPEALDNINEIIENADGIMIARGDLGVELDAQKVPLIQKQLIYQMNQLGKPVITATQMLESMVHNPRPTRAEASDVANAVLDGTDAVMLSAESASGRYPIESVKMMNNIIQEAEKIATEYKIGNVLDKLPQETQHSALGNATVQIATSIHAKAIVNFTRSGYSAGFASQFRPHAPIFSFTPFLMTARKLNLYRGVYPFILPVVDKFTDMINYMDEFLKDSEILQPEDKVVILAGTPGGKAQTVDFIQIYSISN